MGLISCSKAQPEACISVQQRVTTFFIGEQVQFQASCSKNAADYSWSIGKPGAYQNFTTSSVKIKFEEVGTYEVKLRAVNGQSTDVVSLMVQVVAMDSQD